MGHSDENSTKEANQHLVCLPSWISFLLKIHYVLLVIFKYNVRIRSTNASFLDADTLDDILVKYIQRCHKASLVYLFEDFLILNHFDGQILFERRIIMRRG